MNWRNVKLICFREMRDQLRDRRTLFLIAVLPVLLYPLMGISFLQLSQFLTDHPSRILVVGLPDLPDLPSLVEHGKGPPQFAGHWLGGIKPDLLIVDEKPAEASSIPPDANSTQPPLAGASSPHVESQARQWMQADNYDVVIYFPADLSTRLKDFRSQLQANRRQSDGHGKTALEVPAPQIYYNSAKDQSDVARSRVEQVIRHWQAAIGQQNLAENNIPQQALQPFAVPYTTTDTAEPGRAAVWSKILPMVLLLWALTGAFYPAIDLCAGEKERGTLETLLSSPAERSEIVAGKLLTVMAFSMATSILNLASLACTGLLVMRQIGAAQSLAGLPLPLSMPPWTVWPWLLVALVPAAALFSALCLALAAFARSSKEGQYYLMPLVLVTLPLLVLPMAPGVELTYGNSLIPMTGLVLLLRELLDGNGWEVLRFVPPVIFVTGACCFVAIRWAIDQFNTESVLFSDTERLDLRLWLKHLVRDRHDTPTVGAAVSCGVLILVGGFFVMLLMPANSLSSFGDVVALVLTSQLIIIVPALAMTFVLTRNPAKTLLLRRSSWPVLLASLGLAVAVHPLNLAMQSLLQWLYPPAPKTMEALTRVQTAVNLAPHWWMVLLLVALLPAICEELAFRGFILSGLRHTGHKWRAILLSALFFGITHQVVQQSAGAFVLGILIGYVAVQTGSLWPGLLFHLTHNSLVWLLSERGRFAGSWWARAAQWIEEATDKYPSLGWFTLLGAALLLLWLLGWFSRLKYPRTREEQLEEAIAHEATGALHV
jgi:sodium transport system permease protein